MMIIQKRIKIIKEIEILKRIIMNTNVFLVL